MVSKNNSSSTETTSESSCSSPQKIKKSKKTSQLTNSPPSIPLTLTQVLPKQRKEYTIQQKREKWSDEEHDKFIEAIRVHGRDWKKVEEFIGTKTRKQIRSHAQKHFEKMKKTGEEFPAPRAKKKSAKPYPSKKTNEIYNALSNEQIVSNLKNIPNEFFEKLIAQHDVTDAIRLIHLLVTTDSAKTFSEQERALIKTIIHNANILSEKQRQSSMSSESTNHLVFLLSIFTNFSDLFDSSDKSIKVSSPNNQVLRSQSPKPKDASEKKESTPVVKTEPIDDWNSSVNALVVEEDLVDFNQVLTQAHQKQQQHHHHYQQQQQQMESNQANNPNTLSSIFPHLMLQMNKANMNTQPMPSTSSTVDAINAMMGSSDADQYTQYYNVIDNVSNASSFSVEERDSFSQTFDDGTFGMMTNTHHNPMLNPIALCNPITVCPPQQFMYIPTILLQQPAPEHFCNFQIPTTNTLYIAQPSTNTQNFDQSMLSFFDQKDNEEQTDSFNVNTIFDTY